MHTNVYLSVVYAHSTGLCMESERHCKLSPNTFAELNDMELLMWKEKVHTLGELVDRAADVERESPHLRLTRRHGARLFVWEEKVHNSGKLDYIHRAAGVGREKSRTRVN